MGISTALEKVNGITLLGITSKSQCLGKLVGYEVLRLRKYFGVLLLFILQGKELKLRKSKWLLSSCTVSQNPGFPSPR